MLYIRSQSHLLQEGIGDEEGGEREKEEEKWKWKH